MSGIKAPPMDDHPMKGSINDVNLIWYQWPDKTWVAWYRDEYGAIRPCELKEES